LLRPLPLFGGWKVRPEDRSVSASLSWTGCSHGALALRSSTPLAKAGEGAHRRGGVITMVRGFCGASSVIMAVSARKRCSARTVPPWSLVSAERILRIVSS
jgi:hypothetical protein